MVHMTVSAGDLADRGALGWRRTVGHTVHVFRQDPLALFSLLLIVVFVLAAVFGEQIAPYPLQGAGRSNVDTVLLPPSLEHPFGTDRLGRDVLSRVILGARAALLVPIGVVALAVLIGAPLGAIAGYKGGWIDEIIMRVTDPVSGLPSSWPWPSPPSSGAAWATPRWRLWSPGGPGTLGWCGVSRAA